MNLSHLRSKFISTALLQLIVHTSDANARGGSYSGCRGTSNECAGDAIFSFSFIAFVLIYFLVLGNRPAKDCPSFFVTLAFVGISIVLAFISVAIASSAIGLSLTWSWVLGAVVCFSTFAFLLK